MKPIDLHRPCKERCEYLKTLYQLMCGDPMIGYKCNHPEGRNYIVTDPCDKDDWGKCPFNKPESVREYRWFSFINGVNVRTYAHLTEAEMEELFPADYHSWYQVDGTGREKN